MRTWATAIAVIACVLVAAGCASSGAKKPKPTIAVSPAPIAPTVENGHPVVLPISPKGMRGFDPPQGARFLSATRLAIAGVAGSSNCPSVPKKLIVESPHSIRIDLAVGSWGRAPSGRRVQVLHRPKICLADLHPVPVVIAVDPARIDVHQSLNISLYYPSFAVRDNKRPGLAIAPPLPTARFREEVQIARATNRRLFSIFPAVPGKEFCVIPDGALGSHGLNGICQTSIHSEPTMEPSWAVEFTESWWPHCPPMTACNPRALRRHTWEIGEGETVVTAGTKPRVGETRSRGATPPQYYK